jgi:peptidyl-tRNA hydrolase, PTH1 family
MRFLVGLGNPGSAYADTRHNVGFMVVEELARRWRVRLEPRCNVRLGQTVIAGEETMLIEPRLYMNRSGTALADVMPAVCESDLIVIHDDLDLELGCVRVKRGGGNAGHHGLDSIAEYGGNEFTRVRIGIGRPARGEDVVDYVLSPFTDDQHAAAVAAIQRAADAVESVLREGEQKTMNCFNVRTKSGAVAAPAPTGRK